MGWEVTETSAWSCAESQATAGVSQGESRATVPAMLPCSRGWEVKRGHLQREQPGALRSAAVRGVKGSFGRQNREGLVEVASGCAGSGSNFLLGYSRVASAILADALQWLPGDAAALPLRVSPPWKGVRNLCAPEGRQLRRRGRAGSAGRGGSIAPRESCRQPRAGMTKVARYSPAVCARDLSHSFQPDESVPARTVLQSLIPAVPPAHCQLPGCQATLSFKGHSQRTLQ